MPLNKLTAIFLSATTMCTLYSCTKNQIAPVEKTTTVEETTDSAHVYGLLPSNPEDYANVPRYSVDDFNSKFGDFSTTAAPAVLTLATPAIRYQGSLGSCTAFCGAETYEILYRYKYGAFPPVMSPAIIYFEERVDYYREKISEDKGGSMISLGDVLAAYGVCTEALYAYPSSDKSTAYDTPPSKTAVSDALKYKISNFILINRGDTAAVKNCLRHNIPVMMGFNVYDNKSTHQYFENLTTSKDIYNPLTSTGALAKGVTLLGAHATPIVGYDDKKKAFLVQNSWGWWWGLNGFYYMPYSVFMSSKIVPQGYVFYATI